MFVTSAGMSMTPQKATPTTASPLAPNLKTSPPTGSAPSAVLAKKTSRKNK